MNKMPLCNPFLQNNHRHDNNRNHKMADDENVAKQICNPLRILFLIAYLCEITIGASHMQIRNKELSITLVANGIFGIVALWFSPLCKKTETRATEGNGILIAFVIVGNACDNCCVTTWKWFAIIAKILFVVFAIIFLQKGDVATDLKTIVMIGVIFEILLLVARKNVIKCIGKTCGVVCVTCGKCCENCVEDDVL